MTHPQLSEQPVVIAPLTVARRVGPAWVLVTTYDLSLPEAVKLLNQLALAHLAVRRLPA